jgi:hypothetical protein
MFMAFWAFGLNGECKSVIIKYSTINKETYRSKLIAV